MNLYNQNMWIALLGIVFSMLVLTGCSPVRTVYRTEYEIKEVLVPVPVEIPDVSCSFRGDDVDEIMNQLILCISKQKRVLDILKEKYHESQEEDEEEMQDLSDVETSVPRKG